MTMTGPSFLRRLAERLTDHAGRMLPKDRAGRDDWASAMRGELEGIEDDGAALRWAMGCLYAGYAERIAAAAFFDTVVMRALLLFVITLEAWSNFFATIVTIAYRSGHLGLPETVSGMMPGDDYRPFIPLMNAIPWWVHVLWVSSALFYLGAAGHLFTRQRGLAFPLFTAGFALSIAGEIASRIVMAAAGLTPIVGRAGSMTGRVIQDIPEIYLPLAIILALWAIRRRPRRASG